MIKKKLKIYITATANYKINEYIKRSKVECAWFGFVKRLGKSKFFIKNVELFPQECSSCRVESIDGDYDTWAENLSVDNFNSMRLHGHSHVNMSVGPSATDVEFMNKTMKDLHKSLDKVGYSEESNPFYIFMIRNKRGETGWTIFDAKTRIAYKDDYINVEVVNDNGKRLYINSNMKKYCKMRGEYNGPNES